MLELDGRQYVVQTPAECTQDMLDRINRYCSDNNVLNSKGEQIYFEANFASPLYLILWAAGYLVSVIQNLIYSVAKGLNIQSASDRQLLNIADMAGIKRRKASLTTFNVIVRAMSIDDPEYNAEVGTCTITTDSIITYGGTVYYPAIYPSLVLQPGETGYLTMVAQTAGSFAISENSINGFDTKPINLKSFTQEASIPGNSEESIASLRQRLQRRQYSGTSIDAAQDAILGLEGVTSCGIYINMSLTETITVGSRSLPVLPRHALVIIQGYNTNIAKTFYEHLMIPSTPIASASGALLETQYYVTHANQQIPVYLAKPVQVEALIRIYLNQSIDINEENAIKTRACDAAAHISIGETLTSTLIANLLEEDYSKYGLEGIEISKDGGSTYSFRQQIASDEVWLFRTSNIVVRYPEQ